MRTALALVLLAVSSAALADFSGTVVRVVDDDTLDVLVANRPVRVRLAQINAPERSQAYGARARQALSALAFRRSVTVADVKRTVTAARWAQSLSAARTSTP